MSFTPNPEMLQQAVNLLVGAHMPGANQMQVQAALDNAKKNPEFILYLVYMLTQGGSIGLEPMLRQVAGLVAKGNVESVHPSCSAEIIATLRALAVQGLADPDATIRKTANNIVATLARQLHALETWKDLFPTLVTLCQNPNELIVEAALATLANICEDVGDLLDSDTIGRPLNDLFPLFLRFATSNNAVFVRHALDSMFNVLGTCEDDVPIIVLTQISPYVDILSKLTQHPDSDVRNVVCKSLIALLDKAGEHLLPIIPSLTEYFLTLTQSEANEKVLLTALEYWSALCEAGIGKKNADVRALLASKFPVLLPLLIRRLQYSVEELADLPCADVADEGVADAAEDVRPFTYKAKDEEDDPDRGPAEQWTIRRCCAIDLDTIACAYGSDMLPVMLQTLQGLFSMGGDTDAAWNARECGILALGTIAEGCGEFVSEHFSVILPFLVSELRDSRPLIRSTTAWTLGRYALFIVPRDDTFNAVLDGLLPACIDHTKKVQETSIAALGEFIMHGGDSLSPFLPKILTAINIAFTKYQAKNLLSLFDTVGCLAEAVGSELQAPEYSKLLLEPIIMRWNAASDDDELMFLPLVECLVFVATALGPVFAPFAPEVYKRCMNLLERHLTLQVAAKTMDEEAPPKNFIVVALDMLDGVCGALEGSFESFMAADRGKLMPMVLHCMQDPSSDVQQSTYALLGDLVLNAMNHVAPHLGSIMPLITEAINPARPKVTSNAVWCYGELAKKLGPAIAPVAGPVVAKLAAIINDGDRQVYIRSLLINCAACMGRILAQCPEVAAGTIATFFYNWCRCTMLILSCDEIEDTLNGIAAMLVGAPALGLQHFQAVCYVVSSASSKFGDDLPEPAVIARLQAAFAAMRNAAGPQWNKLVESSDPKAIPGIEALIGRFK